MCLSHTLNRVWPFYRDFWKHCCVCIREKWDACPGGVPWESLCGASASGRAVSSFMGVAGSDLSGSPELMQRISRCAILSSRGHSAKSADIFVRLPHSQQRPGMRLKAFSPVQDSSSRQRIIWLNMSETPSLRNSALNGVLACLAFVSLDTSAYNH